MLPFSSTYNMYRLDRITTPNPCNKYVLTDLLVTFAGCLRPPMLVVFLTVLISVPSARCLDMSNTLRFFMEFFSHIGM